MASTDLEEYRQRHQQRHGGSSQPVVSNRSSVLEEEAPSSVSVVVASATDLVRVHVLPLVSDLSGTEIPEADRVEPVTKFLSLCVKSKTPVKSGQIFEAENSVRFVVAKTEPESGGLVVPETDFYVNGPCVVELTKLQLVAMQSLPPTTEEPGSEISDISDRLFTESLGPYIESSLANAGGLPIYLNQCLSVENERYVATALDPATTNLGLVTANTMVYLDVDTLGDFSRIHILPFQDTLPRAYDFDVFEDYLRPYFSLNPAALFSVNTQFVFRGVQFKVVCVDPSDGRPRHIGPRTLIHCEGLLHASLRNMLPPELLEQLSALPPGLQMLLINTELLASGDVLDRFLDLQETLATRRGVSEETLAAIPIEQFNPDAMDPVNRPESTVQCMICLSEFEAMENLRRLPCAHVYHQACIDEWLHRCTDCPLCKTNVERAIRNVSSDS